MYNLDRLPRPFAIVAIVIGAMALGGMVPSHVTTTAIVVRADTNTAARDSTMNAVLKQIAGRENLPAESVFKNIRISQGRTAGQLLRVMNLGFGRALGV